MSSYSLRHKFFLLFIGAILLIIGLSFGYAVGISRSEYGIKSRPCYGKAYFPDGFAWIYVGDQLCEKIKG